MSGLRNQGCALVTETSSGIGAAYADRLAKKGYDLILVARRRERLESLAARLRSDTGVAAEVLAADLSNPVELRRVEARISSEKNLAMLVNNAGLGDIAVFGDAERDRVEQMIAVNVLALTRLTHAALPGMIERGGGTIINIASGLAFNCMKGSAVYGATKAYVAHFTEVLHEEVRDQGIRLQALVPGLTRTNLGGAEDCGLFDRVPPEFVMSTHDLVDASLAGLDLGELVCIPRLEDPEEWTRASAAIRAATKSPPSNKPAARYGLGARADDRRSLR